MSKINSTLLESNLLTPEVEQNSFFSLGICYPLVISKEVTSGV